MATKFYLHNAVTTNPGTLPASNVSISATTPAQIGDNGTNRSASLVIGTANPDTEISITTAANQNNQASLIARFLSAPIAAQTISGQTTTFHIGGIESNAASNFFATYSIAVWRPSTGTKVGLILDLNTGTGEPGTTETAISTVSGTTLSQTSQDQDILVFEIWRDGSAQSMSTAYTNTISFDGTTEDSITTNAAYITLSTTTIKFQPQTVGQAQAAIKITVNTFSQSQAFITKSKGLGQAQADIKATSNQFAQAQAKITTTRNYAQALGTISGLISAYDTFTRSASNGFGTADRGGDWTIAVGAASIFSVDGSKGIFSMSATNTDADIYLGSIAIGNTTGQAAFTLPTLPSAGKSIAFGLKLRRNTAASSNDYTFSLGVDETGGTSLIIAVHTNGSTTILLNNSPYLTWDTSSNYILRVQIVNNSITDTVIVRAKAWKDTSAEPDWVEASHSPFSLSAPAISPDAISAFVSSVTETSTVKIDNLFADQYIPAGWASAKADIKATIKVFAQAQADIKQTYNGFSQAQAHIFITSLGYAQGQARILQTYNALSQAQAQINSTGIIRFISEAAAGTNTVALPTFAVGDIGIVAAYRSGSNTAPTLPAGWTAIDNSGADTNAMRVGYRVLQSGDTDIGVWTNSSSVTVSIFRNQNIDNPIGGFTAGGTSSNLISYPAVSLVDNDGRSWVLGVAGHRTATNVGSQSVTGMTNRSPATTTRAVHTAENVLSFIQHDTDSVVNASSGWRSYSIELRGLRTNSFAQTQADILRTYTTYAQAQAQIVKIANGLAQSMARIGPTTYERILRGISGLQSFWTLGEPSTKTTIDDYKGAITGTVNGTPTFSQASANSQQLEPGIKFSADTQYLTFGDNYNSGGAVFSVIGWIKHTGAWSGTNETIISKNSGATGWAIKGNSSIGIFILSDSNVLNNDNELADTWQFFGAQFQQFSGGMFLDDIKSTGSLVFPTDNTNLLTIGKLTSTQPFSGAVGSVAIFNTAVSFDDFQALYTVAKSGAIVRPAQAQARIKQTYQGFAQAQADILARSNGFAQAQAYIKGLGKGQAAALIAGTYFLPFLDTFTRTVSNDLGTSDNSDAWILMAGTASNTNVNGSQATILNENTTQRWELQRTLAVPNNGLQFSFKISIDKIPAAATQTIQFGLKGQRSTSDVTGLQLGIQASNQIIIGYALDGTTNTITSASYVAGDQFNAVIQFLPTSGTNNIELRTKTWKVGDTEPGWSITNQPGIFPVPQHIRLRSSAHALDANAPFTWTLDDLQIVEANLTKSSQAQAKIKQTYNSFAQAQTDILATSRGYSQAQADILQTYNSFAQSQADIKATYQGYAQAQAFIAGITVGYAQSQADILQTYNSFAQAQADILKAYNAFAQTQANIKATYQGYAQAQARILQVYNAFAQAQADILATYTVFAQAQADIKTTYNALAQAQADILKTYQGYAQSQADIKATSNAFAQAQTDIKAINYGFGQAQADIQQIYRGYAQSQADIKQIYNACAQSQANIKQTYQGYGQAQADIQQVSRGYGQANADVLATALVFAQSQADVLVTYRGFAQAQSDIKQTYNAFGQTQADIKQSYVTCANAQSSIKQTYQAYAQAQADIKAIIIICAQAQADILTSYQAYAQAQADIVVVTNGYGQAQATVLATYNRCAQAQADILARGYAFSQAQAKINAFGVNGYGQAQGNIQGQTYPTGQAQAKINAFNVVGCGNSQGDIKQTYYGFAQAQATILATLNTFAQSQADILKTYNGFGQANSDIRATGQGYGQSQSNIKQTYQDYAQSQATIKATNNGYAQAQSTVKVITNKCAQAQADIKVIVNQFSQTQSNIKQTYQSYGQAQGYISTTIRQEYGQAQSTIQLVGIRQGHAQADILVTSDKYAQAQARVKQIYQAYGQSNALIRITNQEFAQAQGQIKRAVTGVAQAQSDILVTKFVSANAQGLIVTTVIVSGQAQALIASVLQFAQAQGIITVDHTLKSMILSDRGSLTMALDDKLIESTISDTSIDLVENDMQITIGLNNRQASTLESNDKAY